MARKRKPAGPTAAEKRQQAARRAELRALAKKREEAAQRQRSRAAKKGWETRRKNAKPVRKKVIPVRKKVIPAKPKTSKPKASKTRTVKPKVTKKASNSKLIEQLIKKTFELAIKIYGTRAKAKRHISRMTDLQRIMIRINPTRRRWNQFAGDPDQEDEDGINPFWYH